MNVSILSSTPDPERVVAVAAGTCYAHTIPDPASINQEKLAKRLHNCMEKEHLSVFEHVSYTFSIEGISRITSHQLVRHRLASFSQQSQRYVRQSDFDAYVIPPSISDDEELQRKFRDFIQASATLYEHMVNASIPPEDARYLLPQAFKTNIVVTMNARELLHFFSLRCCKKAQWEIRRLAWKMLRLVNKDAPLIFKTAGPACVSGFCPQQDKKCYEKMSKLLK